MLLSSFLNWPFKKEPKIAPEIKPAVLVITPVYESYIAHSIARRIQTGQSAQQAIDDFVQNSDEITSEIARKCFEKIWNTTPEDYNSIPVIAVKSGRKASEEMQTE